MAKAISRASSGRPGPVFVSVPQDVCNERSDASPRGRDADYGRIPRPGALPVLLDALLTARRPLIFAGGGLYQLAAGARIAGAVRRTHSDPGRHELASPRRVPQRPPIVPRLHQPRRSVHGVGTPSRYRRDAGHREPDAREQHERLHLPTDDHQAAPGGRRPGVVHQPPVPAGSRPAPSAVSASPSTPSQPNVTLPSTAAAGLPVTLTASSVDPGGSTLSYVFNWGDGSAPVTSASSTVSHTYASPGDPEID